MGAGRDGGGAGAPAIPGPEVEEINPEAAETMPTRAEAPTATADALRAEVARLRALTGGLGGPAAVDGQYELVEVAEGQPPPPGAVPVSVGAQVLTYDDGGTYEGETVNAQRHGRGTHRCANGDTYEGQWRYDQRHGRGTMAFANGLRYEGEWRHDKTEGAGECWYPEGAHYVGDWRADHRWGWGKQDWPDGALYEGEWLDDVMHGKGRLTFADGSSFEGEFVIGDRRQGKFVAGDGSSEYTGAFADGLREGYGVFHLTGAMKYLGEWRQDQRHGRGRCEYADGLAYDGEWRDDLMHGAGKLETAAGEKYEGAFKLNARDGHGVCTYEDGARYVGQWRKNARSGAGTCAFPNGDVYEGEWRDDRRHGKGACTYGNGDAYEGDWRDGCRHGHGVCVFADGARFRGAWEDDAWVQSTAEPAFCRVSGDGTALAVAGREAAVRIEAFDDAQERRLGGGDPFTCCLEGPETLWARVEDGGDGTYLATYMPTRAGEYKLHVTIGNEEPVGDSPFFVRVEAGPPCPRRSAVVGEGRRRAAQFTEAEFAVEPRDALGNRCVGVVDAAALPLEVSIRDGAEAVPVRLDRREDGRVVATYTPAKAGLFRLDVSSAGKPVGQSPYSLRVAAAGALDDGEEAPDEGEAADADVVPVVDQLALWAGIAKAEYAADGDAAGWDSEPEEEETEQERYIKENPHVPVIEHLEDIWKVGQWQRQAAELDRKEKAKRLKKLERRLRDEFGDEDGTGPEEVDEALRGIAALD